MPVFKTSELPQSVRDLVALTGRRPRSVIVELQAGPATVRGAWHTDAKSFGKVVQSETNNWVGSDGEPNVSVTEVWDAPVAQDITGYSSSAKTKVRVTIGNLRELCPTDPEAVTPEMLDLLFKASVSTLVEATGKAVETASPGPFNDLTEDKVVGVKVIGPDTTQPAPPVIKTNDHLAMLDAMGLT